jgi:hypothetical protein
MNNVTVCVFCYAQKPKRPGRVSNYCSNECRDSHRQAIAAIAPSPQCKRCQAKILRSSQARYCSTECKEIAWAETRKKAYRQKLKLQGKSIKHEKATCHLKTCRSLFIVQHTGQKFCSGNCREKYHGRDAISRGDILASRIYFGTCVHCGKWKATQNKLAINRLSCQQCQDSLTKRRDTRKSHMRRAAGEMTMTVEDLACRDGAKCNICQRKINMNKSGLEPLGPTIDHILPVSKGGTNDPSNLALAHRRCNVSRGNRQPAQMMLEVTDARATSQAS